MGLFDFLNNKEDENAAPVTYGVEAKPKTFDLEGFKKQSEDAQSKKALLNVAGNVFQNAANAPSFYELHSGKRSERPDIQSSFKASAEAIGDPMERQAKTFELYSKAKQAKDAQDSEALLATKKDPNSRQSKAAKMIAQRFGIAATPEMSAYDVEQMLDPKKMMETEAISRANLQNQKSLKSYDHDLDLEKTAFTNALKNSSERDPKNLSASDKSRYDNANMVMKAINEMGGALDDNENTFSLVGDNNYTAAERRAAEAFGRMQSGGAINKDEEKRFMAMLPRATDSAEMQRKKLRDQSDEMKSRLRTLGFDSDSRGATAGTRNVNGQQYEKVEGGWKKSNSHPQDQEAIQWAKSNPHDPRAEKILKSNGAKLVKQDGHTFLLNQETGEYEHFSSDPQQVSRK